MKGATILLLCIQLGNIWGYPLFITEKPDHDSEYSLGYYEKWMCIAFLVLLGGVFAGKKKEQPMYQNDILIL